MVYKKLTTDQITQVEAQAGKEATKLLDECLLAKDSVLFDADGGDASSVANIVDGVDGFPMALKINILPAQAGSGTPAPDNVRKLSGWEGVKLYHSGNDTSAPTEHDIAFPPAAGTVYGGTLEIAKDGSGTLTVNWAYLDGTGWVQYASANGFVSYRRESCPDGTKTSAFSQGEAYASFTDLFVIQDGKVGVQFPRSNLSTAFIRVPEEFNLSNVQLVYPILNPQTYTLTAEQIKSLFGVNNVWVDCGNTQITEYKADIKLYLDAKIAELQALILENA